VVTFSFGMRFSTKIQLYNRHYIAIAAHAAAF
jgi:hypothetical protein